jgi:hypothetical protein
MSHFINIKTQLRERDPLITALRGLHHRFQASERNANDILVRGFLGKQAQAEIVVDTGTNYDIGFQRKPEGYEMVADWWGVEQGRIKQQSFLQQLHQQYSRNIVHDQVREQNLMVEDERTLENGDIIITLSERAFA